MASGPREGGNVCFLVLAYLQVAYGESDASVEAETMSVSSPL